MENKIIEVSQMGVIDKPVAETMRHMKITDVEKFPIEKLLTVRSAIERLQKILKIKFTQKTDPDFVTVTRIS